MRCNVEVAALRAAPRDDAEQVTQALRGEPLEVEERRDGWALVRTAYDYPGWLRIESVCDGEPLSLALGFLGAPYEWGGMSVAGIDCSGLVHIAYRLAGRLVPRDAWQQEAAGSPVSVGQLGRGDLLTYGGDRADHVAFWLGGGNILHSRSGAGVVNEPEPPELHGRRRVGIRL